MLHIKFKYRDAYSNGKWNTQECECASLADCIKFYGLDQPDVEYEIIEMKDFRQEKFNKTLSNDK